MTTRRRPLERLLDAHLPQRADAGRYHLHDLVGTYATKLAHGQEDAQARRAALRQLFDPLHDHRRRGHRHRIPAHHYQHQDVYLMAQPVAEGQDRPVSAEDRPLLLPPVPAGGSVRRTATIGWFEDDATLAMGYLEAADVLTAHWKKRRPNDSLAVPILGNYRHGIELALKAVIRRAARCLRADDYRDAELRPANLNAALAATHSIGALAERLVGYFAQLDLDDSQRLPDNAKEVLEALHALDDNGQWFRYSTVKKRTGKGRDRKLVLVSARPEQVNFDLEAVTEALHDAGNIVLHGGLGVLEEYAEWQTHLRDAAGW